MTKAPLAPMPTRPPTAAPDRSLEQRLSALDRANEIRTARAGLKRDLKAGRRTAHTLILDPPEWLATAKLFDLLLAMPKYGRVKVNRILKERQISPSKTVGGLSDRQRCEVVSYLHPPADIRDRLRTNAGAA